MLTPERLAEIEGSGGATREEKELVAEVRRLREREAGDREQLRFWREEVSRLRALDVAARAELERLTAEREEAARLLGPFAETYHRNPAAWAYVAATGDPHGLETVATFRAAAEFLSRFKAGGQVI